MEWIYIGLQIYEAKPHVYLLDFQRVGSISSPFDFMTLSSRIINHLKPPAKKKKVAALVHEFTPAVEKKEHAYGPFGDVSSKEW